MPGGILPTIKKIDPGFSILDFVYNPRPRWLGSKEGKEVLKYVAWDANYARLSSWSSSRLRYINFVSQVLDLGDADQNIAVTLYYNSLDELVKRKFDNYGVTTRLADKKKMKELGVYSKKAGEAFDSDWRFFVDLDRLGDYMPYTTTDVFVDDIKEWVQAHVVHTWDGDEELWYTKFKDTMRNVLFRRGVSPTKKWTVDQFLNNGDMWATSGSSFDPALTEKLKIRDEDLQSDVAVKNTKWATRWHLSKSDIKKLMFRRRRQVCKAVQKSELTKVRAVISSDLSLYLKMSFVSLYLDQIFKERDDSTLFMGKEKTFDMWQSFQQDGTYRMPVDQSGFDHNVSLRQILITLDLMRELLQTYNCGDEVDEMMDLIKYGLEAGNVHVGKVTIPITSGLLSGWRWTALLGTLVNIAELEMSVEYGAEHGSRPNVQAHNSQGDDVWLKCAGFNDCYVIWYAMKSFGLDVNPKKFFVSNTRDEYLRRVLDNKVLTGYPARSITSICFRNPIQEKEPKGMDRMRSTFSKWKLFAERSNKTIESSWFRRNYIKDTLAGTPEISRTQLESWMYQDVQLGGLGLGQNRSVKIQLETRQPEYDHFDFSNLIGYKEWLKFGEQYELDHRGARKLLLDTIAFKPVYALPSWIKYILSYDEPRSPKITVEVGLDITRHGKVAVGKRIHRTARRFGIPWFSSFDDLLTVRDVFSPEVEINYKPRSVERIKLFTVNKSKDPRMHTIDGISMTLAVLCNPEKVFQNYVALDFKHKPKSWVRDYLGGKLSPKVSPRNGWGVDATGAVAHGLFGAAVKYFLLTNRPTLKLWDQLLAEVDRCVGLVLETLPLRIVE